MARPNRANIDMAAHWKTQVEQVESEYHRFHERCKRISQRYRDERKTIDDEKKNLNLFWSNIQTLKPAIYSKTPVPVCERRFLDKDTTGRVAATMLERALRYEVSMCGFDQAMRRCRDDYLLVGRGQAWVRYNPQFGDPISPQSTANDEIVGPDGEPLEGTAEDKEDLEEREVLRDSLDVSYVHWRDFYQFPPKVRTEEEILGKGRRIYMSREDLIERFGRTKGKKVPLDHVPEGVPDEGSKGLVQGKSGVQATVYEIWWKPTRKIYFIAKGYDDLLEETDDPLNLEGFFPCPACLQATSTNDTMIPVPDYSETQDQYGQIDNLTKRIDILTQALQVRGVYDASAQGVKRIFEEGKEPDLIPVDSWAMFAEKGGLKGVIDFIPWEQIAKVLQILMEVRAKVIEDLDRATGIWDIMRGTSDARETLGGQRLKQNNGSQRLQERQDDMSRFCRDVVEIMGEIIAEHYDPKTLIQVSGAMYDEGLNPPDIKPQIANQQPPQIAPPQPGGQPGGGQQMQLPLTPNTPMMAAAPQQGQPNPLSAPAGAPSHMAPPSIVQGPEPPQMKMQRKLDMIARALELLKCDKCRGFRIDIETDSTVQADSEMEKASRNEFVQGVTKFIEIAGQTTQLIPEFAPLAAKMLQFAVRGFRVGRDLESAIEDFCEKAEQDAKAAAANPEARQSPEQVKAKTEQLKAQAAIEQEKMKMASAAQEAKADVAAQQIEAQSEQQNRQMEMAMKQKDLELKQMDIQIAMIKANADLKKAERDNDVAEAEHNMKMKEMGHVPKAHSDMADAVSQMANHIRGLHEHITSPIEFEHDHMGKIAAVRKGNQRMIVHRRPDGKPIRVQ